MRTLEEQEQQGNRQADQKTCRCEITPRLTGADIIDASPTGKVYMSFDVLNVASKNSFHAARKLNSAAATAGKESGSTTLVKTWNWLQPSNNAASSSSLGTVSKKPFNIQMHNGSARHSRRG